MREEIQFSYSCKRCGNFWKSGDIEHFCFMCHSPDIVIEKNIPEKVKRCPRCFESALDQTWSYCPRCGGKLEG